LAENLAKQGHNIHLFIVNQAILQDHKLLNEKGLWLHYINPLVRIARKGVRKRTIFYLLLRSVQVVLTIIKVTFQLIKFCKRYRPDVVISYMPYRDMLAPTVICKLLFEIPLVVDYCDLYYCDSLERLLLRFADGISYITLPIKETVASRYRIKNEKLFYLPNGVDLRLFSKPKVISRLYPGKKVVLFVGDLYTLDILIKAAPYVVKKNSDVMFVIIGDRKRVMWKNRVRERGLSKYFHFVGLVPHFRVPGYIFQADVCVNTFSRRPYLEYALPIKLFEYMACGKPIVATRLAGTMEAVKHGFNGFLADPENPIEFAGYINTLLYDEKLRLKMGSRGRSLVQERFTWDAISEMLEDKLLEISFGS